MERRLNNSGGRRRYEEHSMYQLQPPPIPQSQQQLQQQPQPQPTPQPQQQQQQIYVDSQSQPSTNLSHTVGHYRTDLRQLADKLGVKNGGHPPGWVEPGRNKVKYNNGGGVGSSSNTGKKNNRQLGIKLAQRGFKFSELQRTRLNEAFTLNRYPKPDEMELLAYEINVRKEQVKNWFHDQRRKHKKETAIAKKAHKKPMFSAQQRRKLEEFFEKNFHPYPGDSRRIVDDFESRDGHVHFTYEVEPTRFEPTEKSRGFKFSEEQRMRLRSFFDCNKYPNPNDMEQLAHELNVKRSQIKNWFHDQRRKFKRENLIR